MIYESPKPSIVLVHGAFEDGSIWKGVIQRLQRDGYPVIVFANPLRGVSVDAAYLRSMLDRIDGPVILVAHSYGGAVITQAGEDEKVKALVYAASILPAAGEAPSVLIERFPGSSFLTSTEMVPYSLPNGTNGAYLFYQADRFHSQVAADVSESEAAMLLATQRPMDRLCLTEVPTVAAWTNKPTWQIMTTKDLAIPLAEQKFEAERAKSHSIEVDASHALTVSNPDIVVDVIQQASRAIA
ncbi:Alpha/Beta hydrolase protein [Xylogone sp. PMI_703]|nr:Alpha/Beta hydrolase protein [Xylogone sp. PMI_703]